MISLLSGRCIMASPLCIPAIRLAWFISKIPCYRVGFNAQLARLLFVFAAPS
jgi:hypothetical protein